MELIPLDTPSLEVAIFNPTKDDFIDTIQGTTYVLKAYEGYKFQKDVADILAAHLKDKMIGNLPGVITDEMIANTLKDIYL